MSRRKEIMRLQLEVSKMGEEIKALRENHRDLVVNHGTHRERNASVTRYATALEYRLNLFLIEKARTLGQQDAGKALTQRNEPSGPRRCPGNRKVNRKNP